MDEDGRSQDHVQKFAQHTLAWIGIGGALFSVLSFCLMLGLWFGPIKELPVQFSSVLAELQGIKIKMTEFAWQLDALKTKTDSTNGQLTAVTMEQNKLRENVRELEITTSQLVVTTVLKVDFVEWKSQLEKQNANIDTPPLRASKP